MYNSPLNDQPNTNRWSCYGKHDGSDA